MSYARSFAGTPKERELEAYCKDYVLPKNIIWSKTKLRNEIQEGRPLLFYKFCFCYSFIVADNNYNIISISKIRYIGYYIIFACKDHRS